MIYVMIQLAINCLVLYFLDLMIGVCGMRSADQDHRIVSEPIASTPGQDLMRERARLRIQDGGRQMRNANTVPFLPF